MSIHIRQATLDDTQAITKLILSQVDRWQILNERGQVEDLPYERLSIYERWLHGGAWMSIETASIWLSNLLNGAGIPLVAQIDGEIIGFAEVFVGHEPKPFDKVFHLGYYVVHPDHPTAQDDFFHYLIEKGREFGRFTVSISGYDESRGNYYKRAGLLPMTEVYRYRVPAQMGQSFYKAKDFPEADLETIRGWQMSVGRMESSRMHWETVWSQLWNAIPQIAEQRKHYLRFSASGQDALIHIQQQIYDPRIADVYCWTNKSLSKQIIIGIRDWARRAGYRAIVMDMTEENAKLVPEAEKQPYYQEIYSSR